MATDKKHIAVYLDPAVEQALIAFCEQKGMVSKKGFMYSAGVNAVLTEFFGLSSAEPGNTPQKLRNIPSELNNTPLPDSNILVADNIPTDTVTQEVTDTRIFALEERIEVLQESLQESLKALWEALPGKLESGDSAELPKVDSEVAEQLQNDLGNLKAENEKLKQELVDARASCEKEISELRSQLVTERASREEAAAKVKDAQATIVAQRGKIHNLERGYGHKPTPTEGILRRQLGELQAELSDLKQKIVTASELPEAADLLNQLKSKRKKSTASLADVEKILEILEEDENG
jgi:DNA repair exonuclease SbcCD ATPase subunit